MMFYRANTRLALAFLITFAIAMQQTLATTLPDKTLVCCFEASPTGFDMAQSFSLTNNSAAGKTIYNRLVRFDDSGTKLEPDLAERWDISPDGRVVTFHLRRGVKFHTTPWFKPTRDFNAEDVIFTFERMHDPKMPFNLAYPVTFPGWYYDNFNKVIAKIEAPDPFTVVFTLNAVNVPFLPNLSSSFTSILSAEYAAQLLKAGKPSEINWKPVGTGPFVFNKYIKDEAIYFDGNPDYWQPADIQLSRLIFSITPDAAVRGQKLKAHECQVVSAPRLTDAARLKTHPDFQVLSQQPTGRAISYLAYNVTHKPLLDVRVRRALDMAIDKQAIIDMVYEGHAQIAAAPMPPLQWGYDKNLQDAPRNLKQAKALLAQAGYSNGFSISLLATSAQRPYNPNPRLMAEIIQSDWAKIGVKTKIVTYEWGEYIKRGMSGAHDTMLFGIGGGEGGDPSKWFTFLSCETVRNTNFSRWCFKPFEDLIDQAIQTTDVAARTQLYLKAQEIFKREQPFTPIAYPAFYQIIHKNVTNFKIDPFQMTSFAGVGLK
jgi:dipeptide transport system substrate-binding protein